MHNVASVAHSVQARTGGAPDVRHHPPSVRWDRMTNDTHMNALRELWPGQGGGDGLILDASSLVVLACRKTDGPQRRVAA
jgi:hypothetical protein